jgi:molecular chaperone HscB
LDPFEALGVKPEFGLDLASLERRHRELSGALHPDRYASAGAGERRMALGRAIEVNEAFRILKDPVRRAEALLARRGVPSGEGKEPPASPALLMAVMERREALAEIRHSRNKAALTGLIAEVRELEAGVETALSGQFAFDTPDAAEVLKRIGELRYYRRFLREAEAIADEFF